MSTTVQRGNGAAALGTMPVPVAVSLSTLEVRWILPGPRPPEMSDWLKRFPVVTETREDLYFVNPETGGMSVKVRGSSLLEFKLQRDGGRVLDVPGLPPVRVQSCEKWSFHLASGSLGIASGDEWMRIRKDRFLSRLSASGRPAEPDTARRRRTSACEIELTDVEIEQHRWWTLALEATGSNAQAWDAISGAAKALFADGLPATVSLEPSQAQSYVEWLRAAVPAG